MAYRDLLGQGTGVLLQVPAWLALGVGWVHVAESEDYLAVVLQGDRTSVSS